MEQQIFTQLIGIIKDYTLRGSEILGKTEALLTHILNKINSTETRDDKLTITINDVSKSTEDVYKEVQTLKQIMDNSIKDFSDNLRDFMDKNEDKNKKEIDIAINRLIEESKKSLDKCTSIYCPKDENIKQLNNDKKMSTKIIIVLGVVSLLLMLGVILAFTMGMSGMKIWLKFAPKIIPN